MGGLPRAAIRRRIDAMVSAIREGAVESGHLFYFRTTLLSRGARRKLAKEKKKAATGGSTG